MNTGAFEGYIGMRFGDEQLVRDILFSVVFLLFASFAFIFRSYLPLFGKTIKSFFSFKERQNLFASTMKENLLFKGFLKLQTLLLCAIFLYLAYSAYYVVHGQLISTAFFVLGIFIGSISLFYLCKQCMYFLYGRVFSEKGKYKLWNTNYQTLSYLWGISLYLPVLWLMFNNDSLRTVGFIYVLSYLSYRILVIYITIRIFYNRNTGVLFLSSYLCAQEIIPLLFLYEGLNYLQNVIGIGTLWH